MRIALGISRLRFSIPLGLAYVSAALKQAGHDVSLIVFGHHPERAIEKLASDPPDWIAYGMLSGEQHEYLDFHRRLSERVRIPAVWGGPHPTFFPEMIAEEGLTAICIGEAEEAIVEFAARFAESGRMPSDVRNFWVRDESGTIVKNPVRPLNLELDRLPFPDREIFLEAHPILRHHGIKHFIAHRGCPHKCTYCFNQYYHRIYQERHPSYRSRDPELVCEEVAQVRASTRLQMVAFVDDVFTLDTGWLSRFADVYARRVGLPYSCNFRLDNCSPEVADLLAASGCRLAYVGIESGDEAIRRLFGRRMSDETIRTAMRMLNERGIRTITENMIGAPGESFEQAFRTLAINMEVRPTLGNCSIFTPYPGLPLTRYAIQHGYFAGDFSTLGSNYYHRSVLTFSSDRERDRIMNLRSFFSLLSRHPHLWPWVKPLIHLKPNVLLRMAGDLLDGHYLQKCLPYRQSPAQFLRILAYYLKAYR
ncbi:MAG: B12-binding domain-containing radical SAM protein [Candidatus Eisenbacteria bacterium]|nr:B12-binding domain-containing radical SAM protein [Candidatus Eisenbacteria bacterium]